MCVRQEHEDGGRRVCVLECVRVRMLKVTNTDVLTRFGRGARITEERKLRFRKNFPISKVVKTPLHVRISKTKGNTSTGLYQTKNECVHLDLSGASRESAVALDRSNVYTVERRSSLFLFSVTSITAHIRRNLYCWRTTRVFAPYITQSQQYNVIAAKGRR